MAAVYRFLVFFCLLIPAGFSTAEEKPFFHGQTARDAERYEARLRATNKQHRSDRRALLEIGKRALLQNEPRRAVASFSAAASQAPALAEVWLDLARATYAVVPTNNQEKYSLWSDASSAAYLAYRHARNKQTKASALEMLAQTLKSRSYWRPAINAYKFSLSLVATPHVRAAYESLRAEHGFRILDYNVEADALSPRLCVQFSEPLARGRIEFSKFFSIDGSDPSSVRIEGRQACIEGLTHGQRYEVVVRGGLPSSVDEPLMKSARLTIYVRDRTPAVHFGKRAYVLPSQGQQGIPVTSVNTDKVLIKIYRVGDRGISRAVLEGDFQRQFSGYQADDLERRLGQRIWVGDMPVRHELNEDVTTAFPVSDAIPELSPGVYVMLARPEGGKKRQWDTQATQWFIVSDLGLTALTGDNGVHAFVRSLATADPVEMAEVRLIARNNEVLATVKANERGYVSFPAGVGRGEGGMTPALLVAESLAGDYAFLDLTANAFDLTDRGVAGRETPGPLDAYVFTERGIYRPGAHVHVTTVLRDRNTDAATGVPVTLIVTRPDGVEHRRIALSDQGQGGRVYSLAIAKSAMTGTWRIRAHADPKADAIGQTSFLVEDFTPERLELTLTPRSRTLEPGRDDAIRLKGRYLYGPPASNLSVEGDIVVRPRKTGIVTHPGYHFGLEDEQITPVRQDFADVPATDKNGEANVVVSLPGLPRTSKLLEARIALRLREPGGRSIERSTILPIAAQKSLIGIRPLFDGSELGRGETAAFDVILLDDDGQQVKSDHLRWELTRIERHYQWYSRGGSWRYEPVSYTRRVANGQVGVNHDKPGRISVPVEWGRYRLEVTTGKPVGPASSIEFSAGWYTSDNADAPEILEVALDKERYAPGETAQVTIETDVAGKAVVTLLNDGLVLYRDVAVPAGGLTVPISVGENWGPGVYVTAMFYRAMDVNAKHMPRRSLGIKWLALDQGTRTAALDLNLPEKVTSATTLDVPIAVKGLRPGAEAYVVAAAVDVGILNLTRYQPPAPEKWFYAQRKLGAEIRDLYGRLIDGMRSTRGSIRSGGDGGGMLMQGSPPVEAPVSLFSGLVKVDRDGTTNISFDLPEFTGTLKVMAVAWSGKRLGHASGDVLVRDPIAMLITAPRFLTMGDESRIQVDLHNVEGEAGEYQLSVLAESPAGTEQIIFNDAIALETGERKFTEVAMRGAHVGETHYDIRLTGSGGIDVARRIALDVKAPTPSVKRRTVQTLAANGGKLTVSADLFEDLIADHSTVTVSAGPAATFDLPGLVMLLDRYPYGCAEQTTSRALPMLYLSSVSERLGLADEKDLRERIQKAVDRLFELQDGTGSFGLWAPIGGDLWLTAYVTDFLTRAREEGYSVRQKPYARALDRLQNYVNYISEFKKGGQALAYGLYVLARTGRAPIGDLRYYADTRLDRFATPLAKAQLGAALAMYGDKTRAQTAFSSAMQMLAKQNLSDARGDYGTSLRDGAAALTLVAESRAAPHLVPQLMDVVSSAISGSTNTTTQENAWMLLAAKSLLDEAESVSLSVNGVAKKGSVIRALPASALNGAPILVENLGDHSVQATVSVTGKAATPEPATAKGLRVERAYYGLNGKPVDLASARGGESTLRQNQRLVVVLKVEVTDGAGGRLLLVDRLPGGLEIENPRIVDSVSVKNLSWLKTTLYPEHTEFRDDRFVAALNLSPGSGNEKVGKTTLAYVVRAVSPGHFMHPPATVEDMYRGDRFSRTPSGRLTIESAE